jgi:hypothetical protein
MFRQRARSILLLSVCALFCVNAHAGYLAVGVTVTKVSNTNSNDQSFVVTFTGGTGPCTSGTGSTFVIFPLSAAPDADTHKRAYAAALLALTTGMRVTLYNYTSDSCTGASYIEVYS